MIKQFPLNPLLNMMVLDVGKPPQATVTSASAVITGKAAGLTVIVCRDVLTLLPAVAFHVRIIVPPQLDGEATSSL